MKTEKLKLWFEKEKRNLPWRESQNPYHVWVSEIMLQQTQVAVVLPYFERWVQVFPTVQALAKAPIEQVIKLWEGLGYYSRARNLHAAAKVMVEKFGGNVPSDPEQLMEIKGIGPYTSGAILSFAFHQKAAAIDGNVTRVVARFTGIEEKKEITSWVEKTLPHDKPWVVMEGLIELGATICAKKPACTRCPIRKDCYAHRHQLTEMLPRKKERLKTIRLRRAVAVIVCQEHYLVKKVEQGVMQDLFEFPYTETESSVKEVFEKELKLSLQHVRGLKKESHTFTRYRVELFPHLFETDQMDQRYLWIQRQQLNTLPFSSGHRRILDGL